jgi:hypothetical protein
MLPLLWHGLLGDFARAFVAAVGGKFYDPEAAGTQTIASILYWLPYYECFRGYGRAVFLGGLPVLWALALWRGHGAARRDLVIWIGNAASFAAVSVRVPYYIGYLVLPVVVAALLATGPALACLAADLRHAPAAGATVVALLATALLPGLPAYCDPWLAREIYAALLARRHVVAAPLYYRPAQEKGNPQRAWENYRHCVQYLRRDLPRGLAVANAVDPRGELGGLSLVFASGRRAVGGDTLMLTPSYPDVVFDRMVRSLEADSQTAVVTTGPGAASAAGPHAEKLARWHARLTGVIHAHYDLASRFGPLEVWVRKPDALTDRVTDRSTPASSRH